MQRDIIEIFRRIIPDSGAFNGKKMKWIIKERKVNKMDNCNIPNMITVTELQKTLDIGRDTAYNLCRRKDFPSIKLGGEYRILTDELSTWISKQQKNK